MRWIILTGEYPPQPGGVAEYTRTLARGLAQAGDAVTVIAPELAAAPPAELPADEGVELYPLKGGFSWRGQAQLRRILRARPPDSLLVEYTPYAFGWKAMNLPMAWRLAHEPGAAMAVMFHEVHYPLERGQPWRLRLLAQAHRRMAAWLASAARLTLVSTSAWIPLLRQLAPAAQPVCLPVPSSLPDQAEARRVREIRCQLAAGDELLLGHFGTYGAPIGDMLDAILPEVLASRPAGRLCLLGRHSEAFAARLTQRHPRLAERISARGGLGEQELANHLAACDLLLQPYPDGVTTRRSSLMAGLALGRPIVTNRGSLTEPFWQEAKAVWLLEAAAPQAWSAAVWALAEASSRRQLGARGRAYYQTHFSCAQAIARLRALAGGALPLTRGQS